MTLKNTAKYAALMLIGAATLTQAGPSLAQATKLKFSTMESPSDPFVACFTMPLLQDLKAASGGRIDFADISASLADVASIARAIRHRGTSGDVWLGDDTNVVVVIGPDHDAVAKEAQWGKLPAGSVVGEAVPIFPRIE